MNPYERKLRRFMKRNPILRKAGLVLALICAAAILLCLPIFAADKSGSCGGNAVWSYADGTLTIEGSGAMTDYTGRADVPWKDLVKDITTIRVNNGITSVGDYAFYYCYNASTVLLAGSVERIGDAAFWGCQKLDNLQLPDGLTTIGDAAFGSCTALRDVTVPATVTALGKGAFEGCYSLDSAVILAGLETLPERSFFNCRSLTSVYLPGTLKAVSRNAFVNCVSLEGLFVTGEPAEWAPVLSDGNAALSALTPAPFNYGEMARLTIEYVFADGTQAAEPYTTELSFATPYSRTSPTIRGYESDQAVVSGRMFGADHTVRVVYTAIEGYVEPESESESETDVTATQPEKKQNPVVAVIWILVMVLVVGGIVVGGYFLMREKPSAKGGNNSSGSKNQSANRKK